MAGLHQKLSQIQSWGSHLMPKRCIHRRFLLCPFQKSLSFRWQIWILIVMVQQGKCTRGVPFSKVELRIGFHKPNPNNWDKHCPENGGINQYSTVNKSNQRTHMQSRKTLLWNKILQKLCTFPRLPCQCRLWSVEWGGVQSVEHEDSGVWVGNVVCRVWSGIVECEVSSAKCRV